MNDAHRKALLDAFALTRELMGDVVLIGISDATTISSLAKACFPSPLHLLNASKDDIPPDAARNTQLHAQSTDDFFVNRKSPIKFCHGCAHWDIQPALHHLLPGGVLCGDQIPPDILSELRQEGDFWWWQNSSTSTPRPHTKNPLNLGKRDPYFHRERSEVLSAIAASGIKPTKAIELGCSSGMFGRQLKQKLEISSYIGIEIDPDATRLAGKNLDQVHQADISTVTPADLQITDVDLIVALDVLEHLYNPWAVLAAWTNVLVPGGHVVVSIPNIQNISVLAKLLNGNFDYEPEGLLDVTHMRFFTLKSIHQLLTGAGLQVIQTSVMANPILDGGRLRDTGNMMKVGNMTLSDLSRGQVIQLHAYQYVILSRKS